MGDYEVKQEAKYVNCGGNKWARRNRRINPKSLKEHGDNCANRGGDNHIDANRQQNDCTSTRMAWICLSKLL